MKLEGGYKGAIKRALKFGNLKYKVCCTIFGKLGYSNHTICDLEVRNKVYRYVKKHYTKYLDEYTYDEQDCGIESNNIWICWLQGMEEAPDIVKCCYKSVCQQFPDKNIQIIDSQNLFDYVTLPDYVIKKWEQGLISNTLFSDFIRLSVLTQFGGLWLDATVYVTGQLPNYIKKSAFFIYQSNEYDITKVGESWFIKANAHNRILQTTLDLLKEYWKKENKIRDYFLMFLFMKMACDKYPQDIQQMPKIPAVIPTLMQKSLNEVYNSERYNQLCDFSPIHKLTYKNIESSDTKNTFYNYLIGLFSGEEKRVTIHD